MKTILALTVLAIISTITDSSAISESERAARSNLHVGSASSADRRLLVTNVFRPAIANAVQYEDVIYRGNRTTRIASVQAYEVGPTQYASPAIVGGGVGQNNVTVRFTSYRGRGYNYQLTIWGR